MSETEVIIKIRGGVATLRYGGKRLTNVPAEGDEAPQWLEAARAEIEARQPDLGRETNLILRKHKYGED